MSGRHAEPGSPWGEVAVTLLATYVLIWLSPVGHGDAIDRYGAQLFNRLAASRAYGLDGQGARADTQVVLLSDRDLKQLGWVWPATYGDHAGILDALRVLRPRALMIDFAFVDPRPDPTIANLVAALAAYARDGIPVFLASVPQGRDDPGIRKELARWGDLPAPRPELVSVPALVGSTGYSLADAEGRMSGALAVYGALCGPRAPSRLCAAPRVELPAPSAAEHAAGPGPVVELLWGARPDPESLREECRDARPWTWALFARRVVVEWWGRGILERCPFTPTLGAARVLLDDPETFRQRIAGRALFYGAALLGSPDLVDSPVHGKIAGVYAHAMALDNLMVFGSHYKRAVARLVVSPGVWSMGLAAIAIAGLVLAGSPRLPGWLAGADLRVLCLAGLGVAAVLAVHVADPEAPRRAMHLEVTPEAVQVLAVVPLVQGFLLWFLLRAQEALLRVLGSRPHWGQVLVRVGGILVYALLATGAILAFAWWVEFRWLDLMPGHWLASVVELVIGRMMAAFEEFGVEFVKRLGR